MKRSHRRIYYFNQSGTILNCYIKEIQFFFDNWVKSGILYIADLFDRNGCFKPLDEFMIIKDKSNWLCEYKILLLATKSIRKINFLKNASHSNKPNATHFYFPLGYSNIHEKPSKFFYLNLVEKKFVNKTC